MGSILRAGLQMGLAYGVNAVAGALSNQSVGRIDDGSQTTKWEPGTAIPRIYGGEGGEISGIRLPPANVTPLPAIRIDNPNPASAAFSFFIRATWTRSTMANENSTVVELKWEPGGISYQTGEVSGTVSASAESINQSLGATTNDSNTVEERAALSSFLLRVGFQFHNPSEILWSDWKRGGGTFTE